MATATARLDIPFSKDESHFLDSGCIGRAEVLEKAQIASYCQPALTVAFWRDH